MAQVETSARENLRWALDSWNADRETLSDLRRAADAELETDAQAMRETADWLDRLAAEQDAKGKTFSAEENRAQAARYRRLIAGLAASGRRAA